jgi:hypothetical protein
MVTKEYQANLQQATAGKSKSVPQTGREVEQKFLTDSSERQVGKEATAEAFNLNSRVTT